MSPFDKCDRQSNAKDETESDHTADNDGNNQRSLADWVLIWEHGGVVRSINNCTIVGGDVKA